MERYRPSLVAICSKNYPKQLYDKVMQYGGVDDRPKPGRPAEFTEEVWEHVRELIREARARKTRYSGLLTARGSSQVVT